MEYYYGRLILDKVICHTTGRPWTLDDVPRWFKEDTEKWLAENNCEACQIHI